MAGFSARLGRSLGFRAGARFRPRRDAGMLCAGMVCGGTAVYSLSPTDQQPNRCHCIRPADVSRRFAQTLMSLAEEPVRPLTAEEMASEVSVEDIVIVFERDGKRCRTRLSDLCTDGKCGDFVGMADVSGKGGRSGGNGAAAASPPVALKDDKTDGDSDGKEAGGGYCDAAASKGGKNGSGGGNGGSGGGNGGSGGGNGGSGGGNDGSGGGKSDDPPPPPAPPAVPLKGLQRSTFCVKYCGLDSDCAAAVSNMTAGQDGGKADPVPDAKDEKAESAPDGKDGDSDGKADAPSPSDGKAEAVSDRKDAGKDGDPDAKDGDKKDGAADELKPILEPLDPVDMKRIVDACKAKNGDAGEKVGDGGNDSDAKKDDDVKAEGDGGAKDDPPATKEAVAPASAQEEKSDAQVGERAGLTMTVKDKNGTPIEIPIYYYPQAKADPGVKSDGCMTCRVMYVTGPESKCQSCIQVPTAPPPSS